jgi:hypothetical protein
MAFFCLSRDVGISAWTLRLLAGIVLRALTPMRRFSDFRDCSD